MEKRCIFHIPNHLDPNRASASQIRPKKMIRAFEEIGYTVDVIQGYGKERKKQISKIKKNIKRNQLCIFIFRKQYDANTFNRKESYAPLSISGFWIYEVY